MAVILLRGVAEATRRALENQADANSRSVEAEALAILEQLLGGVAEGTTGPPPDRRSL